MRLADLLIMHPSRRHRRTPPVRSRGTVIISVIVALVILQIAILGTVFMGARQQTLTVNRIDGARAFYAAEAAANISMRELQNSADADGDTVVGGISDDGNANNDPLLGVARFRAVKTTAGATTTITILGRAGESQHAIEMQLQ